MFSAEKRCTVNKLPLQKVNCGFRRQLAIYSKPLIITMLILAIAFAPFSSKDGVFSTSFGEFCRSRVRWIRRGEDK